MGSAGHGRAGSRRTGNRYQKSMKNLMGKNFSSKFANHSKISLHICQMFHQMFLAKLRTLEICICLCVQLAISLKSYMKNQLIPVNFSKSVNTYYAKFSNLPICRLLFGLKFMIIWPSAFCCGSWVDAPDKANFIKISSKINGKFKLFKNYSHTW